MANKRSTNYSEYLFHGKLMVSLTGTDTCIKIVKAAGLSSNAIYNHVTMNSKYSFKNSGSYFFEWYDSLKPASINEEDSIEKMIDHFILFTQNELDLNMQVLKLGTTLTNKDIIKYKEIVRTIIEKWFISIDEYYKETGKIDDLKANTKLAIKIKRDVISTLKSKETHDFLYKHNPSHTWKRFQEDYKFGIILNAVEIETDAREYLDSIIRFGSKSIQARDRIYNLAMNGNLMACYELGNVELYAHNYDKAWQYWTKNIKDNEVDISYSSSLISLADILIQHKKYEKLSPESFERLKQIPSFASIYSKHNQAKEYECEILKLLIAAATKDNSIAYNMIGNEIKNHNDLINFSITDDSDDPIVSSLNDLLAKVPNRIPEIKNHPYLRFIEHAANCGNAFSMNVFFKTIAFSSEFADASHELRLKAVTYLCESAELGNHYGLTKAAPFLIGAGFPMNFCDSPTERLSDIHATDIVLPAYQNLKANHYVERGYKYLMHAIELVEHSNYYMPYVFMAYYFNSKSPYHKQVARMLKNDGFDDDKALEYLDIAIDNFNEKDIPKLKEYRKMILE